MRYRIPIKNNRSLQTSHIKPFIVIVNEHNIETSKQTKNHYTFWNPKNGRTLYVQCHRLTDVWGKLSKLKSSKEEG